MPDDPCIRESAGPPLPHAHQTDGDSFISPVILTEGVHMRAFMVYISYEMLALYLLTAAAYIGFTAYIVVALWTRGEMAGAAILAPVVVVSWLGMLGQVMHVAEASAEMRRNLRSN
jgi:hypothetical protein